MPGTTLKEPGKIYMAGNYLLINEKSKGIHVINNTDARNPVSIAFLNIPGNTDMAVKNNILYADNYMDLVVLDLSDPTNISLIKRVENTFPQASTAEGILVDYKAEEVTETVEEPYYGRGGYFYTMEDKSGGFMVNSGGGGTNTKPNMGGSMARFTMKDDYLYVVDQTRLVSYNLSNPESPTKGSSIETNNQIETIFTDGTNLFLGSPTGVFIYNTYNPASPTFVSKFQHLRNCDPVVVDGKYAYVTLRTGTNCGGNQNELDVLDVSNITQPYQIANYGMTNPQGLGVDGDILFLCDGSAGLKVFDINDKTHIADHLLSQVLNLTTYDVIPYDHQLILSAENGIYQYDYTDPSNLELLSKITVMH